MKRVFEIGELVPGAVVLDCNGNPLKPHDVRYCNRYQSSVPHEIVSISIRVKILKTVGGIEYVRPYAYCDILYPDFRGTGRRNSRGVQFESLFVTKGTYVFPQLIPVGENMEFEYKWCDDWSFVDELKKHLERKGIQLTKGETE